ncbi:MAG: hypothetical protein WC385_03745 [Candidatus Paceibacterota bacterium]|jgi:hypothetical protein
MIIEKAPEEKEGSAIKSPEKEEIEVILLEIDKIEQVLKDKLSFLEDLRGKTEEEATVARWNYLVDQGKGAVKKIEVAVKELREMNRESLERPR